MSESVWLDEVDRGLIQELKRSIKIRNQSGEYVSLPDNAFVVRKAEEEFKIETFPCVSIFNRSFSHDIIRHLGELYPITIEKSGEKVRVEQQAIPFNLNYQIDFWAKYKEDINDMSFTWLAEHFRQFNLPVTDKSGVIRSCNVLSKGSMFNSDITQELERIYHSIGNYLIWVEIDENISYNVDTVKTINIDLRGGNSND